MDKIVFTVTRDLFGNIAGLEIGMNKPVSKFEIVGILEQIKTGILAAKDQNQPPPPNSDILVQGNA